MLQRRTILEFMGVVLGGVLNKALGTTSGTTSTRQNTLVRATGGDRSRRGGVRSSSRHAGRSRNGAGRKWRFPPEGRIPNDRGRACPSFREWRLVPTCATV